MQHIKNIAIPGAGAMGSFFASRFSDVSTFSTSLVAGGERGRRLSRDGLIVNGKPCSVTVSDPDQVHEPGGKDLDEWDKVLRPLSPDGKPSMLQDMEAGRKTDRIARPPVVPLTSRIRGPMSGSMQNLGTAYLSFKYLGN